MNHTKKYWKGIEELTNDTDFVQQAQHEFPADQSIKENKRNDSDVPSNVTGSNRRDFLKMMGFGVAAASLAACEAPVVKAIPYLNKPEEIDPTIPNYYASTYVDSSGGYSSILVKTREGRPIKIEPNELSGINRKGTHTRAQASLLTLYDTERLKGPKQGNKFISWQEADNQISARLREIASQGGAIRIVSTSIISPATLAVIQDFIGQYPTARHIVYDPNSASAISKANAAAFGKNVIPSYDFSKAEVIVGINADFLGTWLLNIENSNQYIVNRKVSRSKPDMSRHYQFETMLSITGAKADYRTPVKPSQEGLVVANLYNRIARSSGASPINVPELKNMPTLDLAAKDLLAAKGSSLVVSGSNDVAVQTVVNAINSLLNNYGNTIDLDTPVYIKQGDDAAMNTFVQEVKSGRVAGVIFYNANPVYDYLTGSELAQNLKKVGLKISLAMKADETASLCDYICPDHHYLESWNDAQPKRGYYSLIQPTISPIFKTRQAQESLLSWSGSTQSFYNYLQNYWRTNLFPLQNEAASFQDYWVNVLHNGVYESSSPAASAATPAVDVSAAASQISSRYKADNNAMELVLYEKIGMGNGDQANNPWLQEFPDPISRACWGNYFTLSQATADRLEVKQNDVVRVEAKGKPAVDLPVLVQPGQANETVGIAIGYGREKAGKAGDKVGKNAYPFASYENGTVAYHLNNVTVTKTGDELEIAQVQTHHTIMARPIVQEATLKEYQNNPAAGRHAPKIETAEGPKRPSEITLWDEHTRTNHSWGMVIDLNSCIGCGACVVACISENNIPVVGRQEVINRREMHWIRIDRYYSSSGNPEDQSLTGYKELEKAAENPEVVFQPMLCQHCSNAPCETVCPVLATTHSNEGLNQMTYNRCIGTRYCANNCPYKVRRFNWFKYPNNDKFDYYMNNDLGKMVLNPDVTVRSRGVMEKCTFCVQRIQGGKLRAKIERRRTVDEDVVTACASACPTDAIVFGDLLNPESRVARLHEQEYEKRAFRVLEEINTKPQISYLTQIKNKV